MRRSYLHSTTCPCSHCARAGRPVVTTIVADRGAPFTLVNAIVSGVAIGLISICTFVGAADLLRIVL